MDLEERRSYARKPVQHRKYTCHNCKSCFQSIYSLKKHVTKFHSEIPSTAGKRGIKCPLCTFWSAKVRLYDHFARDHQIKLVYETKIFTNLEQFLSWKVVFEKDTVSKFVCYATHPQSDSSWKRTYNCQRTGSAKVKPTNNRVYKAREAGSNKINGFCPARINLHVRTDGSAEAVICKTHVGHTNELGRLTLTKEERTWLASRIAEGISFSDILDEIRDTMEPTKLERLHLTTRKDLHNIAKQFNLTENDALKRIDHFDDSEEDDMHDASVRFVCRDDYDEASTTSQEFDHKEDVEQDIIHSDEESSFTQRPSPGIARRRGFQLVASRDYSKEKSFFKEMIMDHADSASVFFSKKPEFSQDSQNDDSEDSNIFQEDNILFVVVNSENLTQENTD